ncbi:MAG: formylglycine-generating enzyme family protein [Solirubrobacterales bacterium]
MTASLRLTSRRADLAPRTLPLQGGLFHMGSASSRSDERPVHDVEVGPFRIGRTPVTNLEYARFLARGRVPEPPWWTDHDYWALDQPVVGVTWFDAMSYAGWLSEVASGVWRLPTEAEWELAARGGLEGAATSWGDALPPGEVPEGPLSGPWPVGRGTPNGFGLCDTGTIVHEWCLDWYQPDSYATSGRRDPRGPGEGERRASRGGSWRHRVRWSPPAARSSLPPSFRYADYGFRIVQEIP